MDNEVQGERTGRLWKDLSLKSSRLMDRERSIGVYPVRRLI